MKRVLKILGGTLAISLLVAFAAPDKKLSKVVSKIWKDQEVTLHTLHLPDTIKSDITRLVEVRSDGTLMGYACYTTAFGCRVGGCAAPTNPNVQSYETFDYIAVYDTDLKIIKVSIAEYGGQYGYEICRAKWLDQFSGSNSGFELNKNVDGISGATVSAQFLIDDLNAVGGLLKDLDLESLTASNE